LDAVPEATIALTFGHCGHRHQSSGEPTWQVPRKLLAAHAEGAAVFLTVAGVELARDRVQGGTSN